MATWRIGGKIGVAREPLTNAEITRKSRGNHAEPEAERRLQRINAP